jgi:hypothetical protein
MRSLLGTLLVIIGPTVCATPAAAQSAQSPAAAAFTEGEARYEAGEWMLSARAFHRAWELAADNPRRALILYNEGRALEHVPGQECEALARYEQFLHDGDGSLPEIQAQLRPVQDRVHELEARMEGQGGCSSEEPTQPTEGGGISPIGPTLIGVGGAALIAAAITGGLALATQGDLQSACGADMRCPEGSLGGVSDLQALAISTDVLTPVGAAIAITGLVLTLVLHEGQAEAPPVAAWVSPSGAGGVVRWEM